MISDIGKINENIINQVYLGKDTYNGVKRMGLRKSDFLINTNADRYDLIFNILEEVERNKQCTFRRKRLNTISTNTKIQDLNTRRLRL